MPKPRIQFKKQKLTTVLATLAATAWFISLVVPGTLWMLWVVLVAVLFVLGVRLWIRQRGVIPAHCCQKCSYDRTGLLSDAACPECGTKPMFDSRGRPIRPVSTFQRRLRFYSNIFLAAFLMLAAYLGLTLPRDNVPTLVTGTLLLAILFAAAGAWIEGYFQDSEHPV